jgi:hypothetical protein
VRWAESKASICTVRVDINIFLKSDFFLSYLVYQGSLNYIIYFYFPILKELIIYVSYCLISINNRLLVVKC